MADTQTKPVIETQAPATSNASKASKKKANRTKTVKKTNGHPKYCDMINEAITVLKERGGSSRQALLKYIIVHYKVGDEKSTNAHLKFALRAGVKNGKLKQSKGTGASGSFKVGEAKTTKPRAKKVVKPKTATNSQIKKLKKPKTKKSEGEKKNKKRRKERKSSIENISKSPNSKKTTKKTNSTKAAKK